MSSSWHEFTFLAPLDSYVDWIMDPGYKFPPVFKDFEPGATDPATLLPMLVSLAPGATLEKFIRRVSELGGAKLAGFDVSPMEAPSFTFELSSLYTASFIVGHPGRRQIPAIGDKAFLALVQSDDDLREMTDRIMLGQKLPADAVCKPDDAGHNGWDGRIGRAGGIDPKGVCIVGVIDEGIAFANERFRSDTCASRVEYFWMQDGACRGAEDAGVDYGRELTKADIDQLLKCNEFAGLVDEDAVYSQAGLTDFRREGHKAAAWRTSHGAHVMDLACGYDMREPPSQPSGEGEEREETRPIICVQLPSVMIADTSGLGLEKYLVDAVDYVFARAAEIAEARGYKYLPVTINFSSGIRGGPHDGTHPVELALDQRILERRNSLKEEHKIVPTEIVLPSGNSHLSRIHSRVSLAPSTNPDRSEAKLTWRISADDKTFSFMEIWLAPDMQSANNAEVEITVCPPNGEESGPVGNAKDRCGFAWKPLGDEILCKVSYEQARSNTARGRFLIAVIPSEMPDFDQALPDPPTQPAPCGDWTIKIKNLTDRPIEGIDAWIHWDDSPFGYKRQGRQSYFVDDSYYVFDPNSGAWIEEDNSVSLIRREGNISGIATGQETIVVGGYVRKELKAARYSAGGPIVRQARRPTPHRTGPDTMAPCEESLALFGILAAGTRSGSVVALNGTSVAAPQVTRIVAGLLADGEMSGRDGILRCAGVEETDIHHHETHHARVRTPSKKRKGRGRVKFRVNRPSQEHRRPD
ncbi:hypothetical protein EOI86_10855 [Hwanghaeella grinnelliae]|uniref:Peptidase S8/S53 domain-containing protein n=1 Tax=Hwanghaeella grinnelliae TaxID=2500179 RepID=A0A3S2VPB3_9PROT|nr:hypothetical protein [Hwanghaeella grinnelliae]RVU35762.1 hypothetical protein EOI86_10855 [Hwanghaeella grinnelliae]